MITLLKKSLKVSLRSYKMLFFVNLISHSIYVRHYCEFIIEDVETEKAVNRLCSTMRQHRLDKKHLYTQAAVYAKPNNE